MHSAYCMDWDLILNDTFSTVFLKNLGVACTLAGLRHWNCLYWVTSVQRGEEFDSSILSFIHILLLILFPDPRESETFVPVDMHQAMEVRLGLSKGPVSRSFF